MEPSLNRLAKNKPYTLDKTASPLYIRHFLLTDVQMISPPWGAWYKIVWKVKRWHRDNTELFVCLLYLVIAGLPEYEVLKLLRDLDDFFWTIAFFRHSYHASQFHKESLKWNHDDTTQNTVLVNYASDKVGLLNALKMQFC